MNGDKKGSVSTLLSVKKVASRLGISPRTVWRLVSAGQLPRPLAIGRCRRWKQNDIDTFVESLAA